MKSLRLMLMLLAIEFSSNSNAVENMGVPGCNEWVNRHSANDSSMQEWLLGYLSGIAAGKNIDLLEGAERKSLFLWMDKYCKKNPLKRIDSGAHDLALELIMGVDK